MDFTTSSVDLSLRNAETGRPLTATVYDVTLDNGTMRTMSVGQLVMAICLKRATEKEADVVAIMEDMATVTANIEVVSDIESRLLKLQDGDSINSITGSWTVYWSEDDGTVREATYTTAQAALNRLGVSANTGLRNAFHDYARRYGWQVFIPRFSYTTDNAAMIAIAGYFKYLDHDFCPMSAPAYSRVSVGV